MKIWQSGKHIPGSIVVPFLKNNREMQKHSKRNLATYRRDGSKITNSKNRVKLKLDKKEMSLLKQNLRSIFKKQHSFGYGDLRWMYIM